MICFVVINDITTKQEVIEMRIAVVCANGKAGKLIVKEAVDLSGVCCIVNGMYWENIYPIGKYGFEL